MSAGYIRRYTSEPTEAELLSIEGVVILDRDPPAAVNGAGTGTVLCIGEFEDGPFNTPTQIASRLLNTARTDTINGYDRSVHGRGEASITRAMAPASIR